MMTASEFRDANCEKFGFDGNAMSLAWREYCRENLQVGDGATVYYWTDANAYTIIKRTPQTLTLRRCKAILDPAFKPDFIPGGFFGTVVNQDEQTYTYEEDEDGQVITAHWSKKKHGFYWQGLYVGAGRYEFYDYNF